MHLGVILACFVLLGYSSVLVLVRLLIGRAVPLEVPRPATLVTDPARVLALRREVPRLSTAITRHPSSVHDLTQLLVHVFKHGF